MQKEKKDEIAEETDELLISVIVPVYNAEKYLSDTFDSLVSQSMPKDKMEVIVVDDGSTDNSLDICRDYEKIFSFFYVYTQENSGVAESRNRGMSLAKGKYIMFLDSDDKLDISTVENVVAFFEEHFYETDLVTYPLDTYINGKIQKKHYRYDYLKESGIYDVTENIYALQTHMNICIKNNPGFVFDNSMLLHEDQKFIMSVLQEKMTIGFCKEAMYYYMRNEDGIMGSKLSPLYIFETTISFYEELFSKYSVVPEYFQALFVHDLNWKLRLNVLFPYNYGKKDFERAIDRIRKLLKQVDLKVITDHPIMDEFHKVYFIRLRDTVVTPVVSDNMLSLISGDVLLFQKKSVELLINSIKIISGELRIIGALKSAVFDFCEEYDLYLYRRDKNGDLTREKLDLYDSAESYYRCKTKTNLFPGFTCVTKAVSDSTYFFAVRIDGMLFKLKDFYFFKECGISKDVPVLFAEDHMIRFTDSGFSLTQATRYSFNENFFANYTVSEKIKVLLQSFCSEVMQERIWLYYDCRGVIEDNGFYQFIHDIKQEDGIKRYYINANPEEQHRLKEEYGDSIVLFGSTRHIQLFLRSEKILTAFIEDNNIIPCDPKEYEVIKHFISPEIIYLQHGVLHIDMPWKYAPGRIMADKIVISSGTEMKYLNSKGFKQEELLPFGMARFDKMERKSVSERKVLFAPSWRSYLIAQDDKGGWIPNRESFLRSSYFSKIEEVLSSEELSDFLKKNNVILDFKLHPIFKCYTEEFCSERENINVVDNVGDDNEYSLFITDISSYVYNFVYLQKKIIYYIPDYEEFKSGMSSYWNMIIPEDESFGPFVRSPEDLIKEIKKVIRDDFSVEDIYHNRMNDFFISIDGCREKLYKEISKAQ